MAVTRLDWDILTPNSSRLTSFPWITGKVRKGDAYTVLYELCRRFNNEVEKINPAHSWGYASRPVRGASVASEHSAGTAIDLNAPKHPLGRQGTFTRSQVTRINRILKDLDGAVRWGGNYAGRKDEMHFELQGGVKKLAAVAKKIKGGKTNTTGSSSKPSKPASTTKTKSIVYTNRRNAQIYKGTGKNAKLDPQQPVSQNYKLAKLGTKGKSGSWTKVSWKGNTRWIPTAQVSTKKTPIIMRTNRDKVEFFSHRGKSRKSLGFAHNKGYRVALIETAGSWSRVRWSGQNAWVPTAHIDYA